MNLVQLLWQLVKYRPLLYVLMSVAWNFFVLVALVPGLLIRRVFDQLADLTPDSSNLIAILLVLLAVVSLVRLFATYWAVGWEVTFQHTIASLLRRNIFVQLFKLPGAQAIKDSSGEAISRFRDDVDLITQFLINVPYVFAQLAFSLVAMGIMMQINLQVALIVILPLMAIVILVQRATKRIEVYRRANRVAAGNVSEFIGELFGATLAVKVTATEKLVVDRFSKLNEKRQESAVKDRIFSEFLNSISANTVNLGTGVILLLAARDMQTGQFTIGDFSLFVYYVYFVTALPVWLGRAMTEYKQTRVSFERLLEMLSNTTSEQLVEHYPIYFDEPLPELPQLNEVEVTPLKALETRNLTYQFGSGQGIENIDLHLKRGTLTVITGKVGSGKTTLLRVLLGLLPKQAGEILWNGQTIHEPASFFVPPHCAYTSQVPNLFTDTIRDNILMGLSEDGVDLDKAIHLAVVGSDLEQMEQELDTQIGTKGVRLSGGQIQRVSVARMFVRFAELLVMDDVSSALDVETERQLWDRLFEVPQATYLVVSHRIEPLKRADQIIVLDEGRVQAVGTYEELRATNTYIAEISQATT